MHALRNTIGHTLRSPNAPACPPPPNAQGARRGKVRASPIACGKRRAMAAFRPLTRRKSWKATSHLHLQAGYSHFFAGGYLGDTGSKSDADFAYVQATLEF